MPQISNAVKDKWIDLIILMESCKIENGKAVFCYEGETINPTLMYQIRIALRAVGHTLTGYCKNYNHHQQLTMIEFITTISKDECEQATKWANEWMKKTETLYYDSDCDCDTNCDSDTESESESEDPSV